MHRKKYRNKHGKNSDFVEASNWRIKAYNTVTTQVNQIKYTAYYGQGRILVAARDFELDRSERPYKRLSATLILGCKQPFVLEVGDGARIESRVALIAPNVLRKKICAKDANIILMDIPIQSAEYLQLQKLFDLRSIIIPSIDGFQDIMAGFESLYAAKMPPAEVSELFRQAATILGASVPKKVRIDGRIETVIRLVDDIRFEEVSLEALAGQVHLSPSRLRHLFKEEMGCTLSHYIRWANVWKAVEIWSESGTLSSVAEAIGFYDLAHLNRAFTEVFGINPSEIVRPEEICLVHM